MSKSRLRDNLQCLFPELGSLPHHDTLNRAPVRIDVEEISEAMADLVDDLIRVLAVHGPRELKAFRRMAAWSKKRFPRLPVVLLLDGLYPNGPVMSLCSRYGRRFMIVLRDEVLLSVWEEVWVYRWNPAYPPLSTALRK